jgi:predicted regulator of Ras-like GTPase activity (Roadblock/LC7/MglB family)
VLAKPFAADDLLKRLDTMIGPLAPRVAEVATPKAAAPAPAVDATPTLMPVSTLTVAPIEPLKPTTVKPTGAPTPVFSPAPAAPIPPASVPAVASEVTPVEPAHRALEPVAAAPTSRVSPPSDAAVAILTQFTAMDGVQWAVLSDREGFVVEATTNAGVDADVAAALSACLTESSDGLGKELGRGALQSIMLEYEKGMVIVYSAGSGGLLAVGLSEPAVLGKVRYFAKKALPELTRSL